jgi:hypothetical protein
MMSASEIINDLTGERNRVAGILQQGGAENVCTDDSNLSIAYEYGGSDYLLSIGHDWRFGSRESVS